jgi:glycosyltransferase involved in cell wall biosynthesis
VRIPFLADLIVVTHKEKSLAMEREIEANTPEPRRLIFTCQIGQSASVNRNYGLEQSTSDIAVMMDDDIAGFYPGWLTHLVSPLLLDPRIIIASIRCLDKEGNLGQMMGLAGIPDDREVHDVQPCGFRGYRRVPTACIAIRKNAVRFDEGFIGSGYEDTTYMNYVDIIYPGRRFVINNRCQLIHLNTEQNQGGKFWEHNKRYYLSIFPDDASVQNQECWVQEEAQS